MISRRKILQFLGSIPLLSSIPAVARTTNYRIDDFICFESPLDNWKLKAHVVKSLNPIETYCGHTVVKNSSIADFAEPCAECMIKRMQEKYTNNTFQSDGDTLEPAEYVKSWRFDGHTLTPLTGWEKIDS